jgi:hypothetical protein
MDDDSGFPELPDASDCDAPDNDADPTARGIMQCLRMLAEEAATLGMPRTLDALQAAMAACAGEGEAADTLAGGDIRLRVAGSSRVH